MAEEDARDRSLGEKHPYRLGRPFSLGKNRYYQLVYRRGKSFPGRLLVLIYLRAREMKVGFSVSSKVGGAVTRNRLRRWMKEDFRARRALLRKGKYVFSARTAAADAPHAALDAEMLRLLRRAGLLEGEARR